MTDPDASDHKANPFVLQALRQREVKRAAILAGDRLPSHEDHSTGLPPALDDPLANMRRLAIVQIDSGRHKGTALAAWSRLAEAPSGAAALKLRAILKGDAHDDLRYSLDWLAAALGHRSALDRVIVSTMRTIDSRMPVEGTMRAAFAIGLARVWLHHMNGEREYPAGWTEKVVDDGLSALRAMFRMVETYDSAVGLHEQSLVDPATAASSGATAEQTALEDLLRAELREDRAELGSDRLERPKPRDVTTMVVVPVLDTKALTGWRKEIAKSWSNAAGVRLPLVCRGDVAAHRRSLAERWPHAVEVIDTVLSDLAAREPVRFRPTLLVGPPGSGKSALVRAIAETVGLPCELQSFAGLHDAALMGTSAQWNSARESVPLQLIKRSGLANPCVIWDEVEKASQDRSHGAPAEALLPMLEQDQARRYRDLCLEVEVDLSMVSHFATANSLEGVPVPVRDRMRVLTMPAPRWQHLPVLTAQILSRIAAERGIDRRWMAPLAEDELDLVRAVWPGGSIRQLARIVATIVDGRDTQIGRA